MASIKNKYEFYKGFLEALGAQDVKETEYKNEEELRKKILDTMGVDYVFDDVNQTDLFRGKFLEGLANGGSGGGGSSDFDVVNISIVNNTTSDIEIQAPAIIDDTIWSSVDIESDNTSDLNIVIHTTGGAFASIVTANRAIFDNPTGGVTIVQGTGSTAILINGAGSVELVTPET